MELLNWGLQGDMMLRWYQSTVQYSFVCLFWFGGTSLFNEGPAGPVYELHVHLWL